VSEYDNQGRGRPGEFAMDGPLPPGATEPVDVVQVRADDALIAALSRADETHIDDPIDERLAGLLRTWRDDVHAEPERPLVDIAAAHQALASAPRPRRRHNPIGPWATAAAVLVVAFVGMGLAAKGAEPGDPLWNVTKVLYSEKAKSVEAAITVRRKLQQATEALDSGRVSDAKVALEEAKDKLTVVAVEDGQQALTTRTEELLEELGGTTGPTTPPATTSTSAPSAPTSSTEPTAPSTSAGPGTTTVEQPAPSSEPPPTTDPSTPTDEGDPTDPGLGSVTDEAPRGDTSGTSSVGGTSGTGGSD